MTGPGLSPPQSLLERLPSPILVGIVVAAWLCSSAVACAARPEQGPDQGSGAPRPDAATASATAPGARGAEQEFGSCHGSGGTGAARDEVIAWIAARRAEDGLGSPRCPARGLPGSPAAGRGGGAAPVGGLDQLDGQPGLAAVAVLRLHRAPVDRASDPRLSGARRHGPGLVRDLGLRRKLVPQDDPRRLRGPGCRRRAGGRGDRRGAALRHAALLLVPRAGEAAEGPRRGPARGAGAGRAGAQEGRAGDRGRATQSSTGPPRRMPTT